MAYLNSLWFALRIWFLMEWKMARRKLTPEQKAECWRRYGQILDEVRAELEQKIAQYRAAEPSQPEGMERSKV